MAPACSDHRSSRWLPVLLATVLIAGCGAATSGTKDDATIATRVKIALLNDPRVGPLRLDAHTSQGVVTLSGSVKSQAEADTAIAVARKVPGARDVKSALTIVP
jgi:hyperosmotically inducible protein